MTDKFSEVLDVVDFTLQKRRKVGLSDTSFTDLLLLHVPDLLLPESVVDPAQHFLSDVWRFRKAMLKECEEVC